MPIYFSGWLIFITVWKIDFLLKTKWPWNLGIFQFCIIVETRYYGNWPTQNCLPWQTQKLITMNLYYAWITSQRLLSCHGEAFLMIVTKHIEFIAKSLSGTACFVHKIAFPIPNLHKKRICCYGNIRENNQISFQEFNW